MNILALAVNTKGWTTETLYFEQQSLKKSIVNSGGNLMFFGPGYDVSENNVIRIIQKLKTEGNNPDIVLCYEPALQNDFTLEKKYRERYHSLKHNSKLFEDLELIKDIPKVMWINDYWHWDQQKWEQFLLPKGFTDVIGTYIPPYCRTERFNKTFSQKTRNAIKFWPLHRGIDPKIFFNYGEEKTIDVCLLGALGKFYPLRTFCHRTLLNQTWLNYFNCDHPGYAFNSASALTGVEYAKTISKSKIFISCCSKETIPFIKIYEVLACGTALMCDAPCGEKEIGLRDGHNYIQIDRVNFLPKLRYYLDRSDEISRIAKNGHALFIEKLQLKIQSEKLKQILSAVISEYPKRQNRFDSERTVNNVKPMLKKIVRSLTRTNLEKILSRARSAYRVMRYGEYEIARHLNPYEKIKDSSLMDFKNVAEVTHVWDIVSSPTLNDLRLIEKFGLNASFDPKIVLTEKPEVIIARPLFIRDLTRKINAKYCCEVGTARGMQALFWAQMDLTDEGVIYTCDIINSSTPCFQHSLSEKSIWTRDELTKPEKGWDKVRFVHGNSSALARQIEKENTGGLQFDVVFIDGGHTKNDLINDYVNLKPYISKDTVLIFDDCDARFPCVEDAVQMIAQQRGDQIRLLDFWPSAYRVAILGHTQSLMTIK